MTNGLVYIGKIIEFNPIPDADFICSATVVCGSGGKWRGVVRKSDFLHNSDCVVFLPDSQLNPEDHSHLPFMKDSGWRVKMRRFKGAPSEVLITPIPVTMQDLEIGDDVTSIVKVTKYIKSMPAFLNGDALGDFPSFIPKTDEPNYQRVPELIKLLHGKPFYVTEKCDGSSTTAYRKGDHFGVCSRNLELVRNPDNGYWKVALKYDMENKIPDGIALQWETCGPGIQSNPMGMPEIDGFLFSGYNFHEHRYLTWNELQSQATLLGMPMARVTMYGECYDGLILERAGEGFYANGNPREGVVIRSMDNIGHSPVSFKVINLGYEK